MNGLQKKGLLITFEGIDGSGKSSAAQSLYHALRTRLDLLLTREPGATEAGRHIRSLVQERTFPLCSKAEFLLFASDRAQHMQEIVLPALSRGVHVISDRMADSSLAYQGFGRGLDPSFIAQVNEWTMDSVKPDLTVYLRVDYITAAGRLKKRCGVTTVIEQEEEAFFSRVAEGFEAIFKNRPDVILIDAAQSEEIVHNEVKKSVLEFLAQKGIIL